MSPADTALYISCTRKTKRRGFNLIEAAIVLGVVGLVIGGIWVTASSVVQNWRAEKTVADVFLITRNVQNLISRSDANAIGISVNIGSTLKAAKAVPEDWQLVCGGCTDLISTTDGARANISIYGNAGAERFDFYLYDLTPATCIKLATRVSAQSTGTYFTGNNLGYMYISGSPTIWPSMPVSVAVASSACNLPLNIILFTFGLTRAN